MTLPASYEWLAREPGPRMIVEALKEFGTRERGGDANNPEIIAWAREVGGTVDDVYRADEIPWCGLFMAVVAKRAGKPLPPAPLWALSWAGFGTPVKTPMLGDVLVFTRRKGGHVALYVGEDKKNFHMLGGNQDNAVNIRVRPKASLYVAVRPPYRVQPPNVRRIILRRGGIVSGSEQ